MADTDVQANAIFAALTAGEDFSIPDVDFTLPLYTVPDGTGAIYDAVSKLTEADLTSRMKDGTGLFDGLMATVAAHLHAEYTAGRLNGGEYTQAYIAMTQAAMSNAVQYTLSKDTTYWQAQLVQKQSQAAEAAVIQSRIEAEIAKVQLKIAQTDVATKAATYAATKQSLANGEAQYDLQVKEYEKASYELTNMFPTQLSKIIAEVAQTTAAKDQILWSTANKLPAEVSNIDADTTIKGYTHTSVLPAQVANTTSDTQLKAFELDWIKPATLTSINEQMESHRAKTLDTRSDGVTAVTGSVGKQKALHTQQITAYERDAEAKMGKMLLDTWITQKSVDPDLPVPTALDQLSIGDLVTKLRVSHGIS